MNIDDKQWMDNISQHYQWPQPSRGLKGEILAKARASQRHQKIDYLALISDFFPKWEPALAMAFALFLGVCVGAFTVPHRAAAQTQADVYIDADIAFVQAMINQEGAIDDE